MGDMYHMHTAVWILLCLPAIAWYPVYCHASESDQVELQESDVTQQRGSSIEDEVKDRDESLNILLFTIPIPGHYTPVLALGEELVRRGHNVTLGASADIRGNITKEQAERVGVRYRSANRTSAFQVAFRHQLSGFAKFKTIIDSWRDEITTVLSFWFEELSEEQRNEWDFFIVEDFLTPAAMCIHHRSRLPVLLQSSSVQCPFQITNSWRVPLALAGNVTVEDASFSERFTALGVETVVNLITKYALTTSESEKKYCSDIPLDYLTADSTYRVPLLIPTVIGFEYPRIIAPMTHYVGPLVTKSPNPISEDLKQWLEDRDEKSVVYISMGSRMKITEEIGKALISGVLKTNYSVIWALRQPELVEGLEVDPNRLFLVKWAPQFAVLQHEAISMAILHGGFNGVNEALFNGVPVIVTPLAGDQLGIAGRVHYQGLGVSLEPKNITAEAITNAIKEIDSGDYRRNVQRLQKLFHLAGGVEKAADLVEYYKEVGFDHLIPGYAKYEWNWVQYYNVDVYALLALIAASVVYCSLKCCQCVCRRCWTRRKEKSD